MHSNQCHKLRWRQKFIKNKKNHWINEKNFRPQHFREKEDWDKEIEDCLHTTKEQNQPPYDPGDELNTTEMVQCNGQNSTSFSQDHYTPVVHHKRPVKWVRCIYTVVADQFANAEE